MIDVTDVELTEENKANTLIINPRWSYKTHSKITTTSISKQWSTEELCDLDIRKYGVNNAAILLWMTPTALATGKHLEVSKAWKRQPSTIAIWENTTPKVSKGAGHFSDDAYFLMMLKSNSGQTKSDTGKPMTSRIIKDKSYMGRIMFW